MKQKLTTLFKSECCLKKPILAFLAFFVLSFSCINQLHAQTNLGLGDIAFISYNSDVAVPADTGVDQFGFVTFKYISAGTQLTFTDRGWTSGTGFSTASTGEGTITVTFSQSLNPGDQIYIDSDGNVFNQNGTTVGSYTGDIINLNTAGDQIFAYQGTEPTPANQSNFISAIQMNGGWDADGSTASSSALPSVFTDGVNAISIAPEVDNAIYNFLVTSGTTAEIMEAVFNSTNWETNNFMSFAASTTGFLSSDCTLEIDCLAPLVTAICAIPAASPASVTILNACGTVTVTSSDVETGNLLDGTLEVVRTYTVQDDLGTAAIDDDLTVTCIQTIQVAAPAMPTFDCLAGGDIACVADISVVALTPIIECGTADVTATGPALTGGTPNCLGAIYTVTYTATDSFGRIATCVQDFTITNSFPSITCPIEATASCISTFTPATPEFTVSCGGGGTVSSSEPVLISGNENCDGAIYEVTYSVTDNCDRTSDCIQTVTVSKDPIVINCTGILNTATCEADILAATPDFVVSCGSGTVTAELNLTSGIANCQGAVYEVTYTVTDNCNATATCTSTIAIVNEAPTITCAANSSVTCFGDIVVVNPGFTSSCGSTANVQTVGPTLVSGNANQNGSVYEVEYTIADACGRTATCTQTYTITSDAITIACLADTAVDCVDDIVGENPNTSSNCGGSVDMTSAGPILISGQPNCGGAVYGITYTAVNGVGAIATCTQNFILNANAPVVTCAADKIVTCAAEIISEAPSYTVGCAGSAQVTSAGPTLVSGTADCDGSVYEIVYTVTSNCNVAATCTQSFTISNNAPTIECLNDITATCAADIVPVEPFYTVSCGETATVSNSAPVLVSGEPNCTGSVYTITYTVEDNCNRIATCTQNVVISNAPLTIACPERQTVSCFSEIIAGTPSYTTSCNVSANVTTVGPTLLLGEQNCTGAVYLITYTVTDDCGNTANCEQLFAIENNVPTITCPANENVSCVDDIELSDNLVYEVSCGVGATVTSSGPLLREGTPNCPGAVYVANYTVTDDCDRVVSCEQTFTITNAAPSITCVADATVSCASEIAAGTPVFEVSCGGGTLSTEGPNLIEGNDNCDGAVYSIIYTVSDACGRTANCTQRFTVSNALPTIACPQNRNVSCITEIAAETANYTVSCGNFGVVTTEGPSLIKGTVNCPATYAITYTVTDECDRTASCVQEFNINNSNPIITCPADAIVSCAADIVAGTPSFETSCNLTGTYSSVGPTLISGQPDAIGAVYEITYTVNDACGGSANCTQRFTIQNNAPAIICPADVTVICADDIQIGSPIASISCDNNGVLSTTGPDLVSGQPNCNGAIYQVVYTVTDQSNRTESCTQNFTVQNTAPTIVCPDSRIVSCTAEIVGEAVQANSSCGITTAVTTVGPVLISGNADCSGAIYEITYVATDDCNRTAQCKQSFILDNAAPSITCVDAEVVTCIEDATQDAPDFTSSCGLNASIITEGPTLIAGDENCNGALYNVVYTVIDDCGRTASCTKSITIVNDIQLTCPADKLVGCFDELVADTPTYTVACQLGETLDVDGPNLVSGDMFCGGSIYSFTYTVTDGCGRTTSCTQEMTVINCDSDGDGICDPDDICMGFDDALDTNGNGTPDGCENIEPACADADNDGVCDVDDICNGADDNLDADNNGIPDGCDNCENAYFNFTHQGNSWHDGNKNGVLNYGGECANISISDPSNILEHTNESGGGLMIGIDPTNVHQTVNICYDFCQVSDHVYFSIRDLDRKQYGYKSSNQQESVCVSGYLNGSEVLPQITNLDGSVAISGNVAEATVDSKHGDDESIFVEFNQCIDQVCIKYGTGSNSPVSNPTYSKIYIGEGNGIFAEFCDFPCDGATAEACTNEALNFQDQGINWTTNSTHGAYTVGNQTYSISIEDADHILEDTYEHGKGLLIGIEPNNVHDEVVINYALSTISNNVSFKIRDLDRKHYGKGSSNQQEAVCVYGYLNGVIVNPDISVCEGSIHVQGNCAEATANSAVSGEEECIIVSFDKCIDAVKIIYGTGNNSPVSNPTYSKIYIGEGQGFFTGVCGSDCGNVQPCSDADQDGVCDEVDVCANFDDSIDTDGDGIPDACDLCDCTCVDSDLDGVCDEDDICPGSNDAIDMNNNGIPDGCECPTGDSDRDGVCDGADRCPGIDDFSDACINGLPVNADCNANALPPTISGSLDETLVISWVSDGAAVSLEYRETGTNVWESYQAAAGYAVLSNLRRCTDYQVRLAYTCNAQTIYSSITTAKTTGCVDCSTADLEMFVFNIEQTSAVLAWDVMPGAMYQLHYKKAGDANYQMYTTPIPFVVLFGLDDCTSYEFAMSTQCQDGAHSAIGTPLNFTTSDCKGAGDGEISINDGHLISVYPNPAKEVIEISLTDNKTVDLIEIYNTAGQVMISNDQIMYNGLAYRTDVSQLTNGMYFVMTVNGDQVKTKQFIVK